jgi:YD repeat-containing protein
LSRSYDERGNLLKETRTLSAATRFRRPPGSPPAAAPPALVTSYAYDPASRVSSITYPSGVIVGYARDAMGRITALTAQSSAAPVATSVLSNIGYQAFGPQNALTFGNGVKETRSYDLDYRLTNQTAAGTNPVQNLTYGYNSANDVLTVTDGVTAANSQTFGYDALDRLTSAAGAYGTFGWTYDKVGNRLTQTLAGRGNHHIRVYGWNESPCQHHVGRRDYSSELCCER